MQRIQSHFFDKKLIYTLMRSLKDKSRDLQVDDKKCFRNWMERYEIEDRLIDKLGIVPFVAKPLKGRFVVFLKLLFKGCFRLGQVILGQANGPAGLEPPAEARNRRKATVNNTQNRPLRCVATKGTIPKNFAIFLKVRKNPCFNVYLIGSIDWLIHFIMFSYFVLSRLPAPHMSRAALPPIKSAKSIDLSSTTNHLTKGTLPYNYKKYVKNEFIITWILHLISMFSNKVNLVSG